MLLFALRRRLFTLLMYWERNTPAERTKIKAAKWKAQRGLCAICDEPMDVKGSELDRADPVDGYTADTPGSCTTIAIEGIRRRRGSDRYTRPCATAPLAYATAAIG